MDREEILKTVQEAVMQITGREDCSPEMDLMEEAGLSSIEVMRLLSALEDRFGVKIPSRDLRFVATVEDMADLVLKKQKK